MLSLNAAPARVSSPSAAIGNHRSMRRVSGICLVPSVIIVALPPGDLWVGVYDVNWLARSPSRTTKVQAERHVAFFTVPSISSSPDRADRIVGVPWGCRSASFAHWTVRSSIRLSQEEPQRCKHPARMLAVHRHAKPISGFLVPHGHRYLRPPPACCRGCASEQAHGTATPASGPRSSVSA